MDTTKAQLTAAEEILAKAEIDLRQSIGQPHVTFEEMRRLILAVRDASDVVEFFRKLTQ